VVVILRGSSARDLILRDEIKRLVSERGGRLHEIVGSRAHRLLDAGHLRRLVPDIAGRDLYVCGPSGFMDQLIGQARALGVPYDRIHHEDFAF
jgi:ferredoxin-NADP reductase